MVKKERNGKYQILQFGDNLDLVVLMKFIKTLHFYQSELTET